MEYMHKGCTATNYFRFPFNSADVSKVYITYAQNHETIVEKTITDCTIDNDRGYISTELSQADTIKFQDGMNVYIQIRVLDKNNKAFKSNLIVTYPDILVKEGII